MLEFKKILVQVFQYGTAIMLFIFIMKKIDSSLKKLLSFLEDLKKKIDDKLK